MKQLPILLIPEKRAFQYEMLDKFWRWQGGQVRVLDNYQVKDDSLSGQEIAIYGHREFATTVAKMYRVRLLSVDGRALSRFQPEYLERNVTHATIGTVTREQFPAFIKPVVHRVFPSGIYKSIQHFKETVDGIRRKEEIIVSQVIPHKITAKARGFILNGRMMAASVYEGRTLQSSTESFIELAAEAHRAILPATCVIDVADTYELGWMVLGIKNTWETDLKGCSARGAIDCIVEATLNK